MIELSNVTKTFKNETVLKETTVSFEQGKIIGIVGRNGSGKTVLLKIICGLLSPSTGSVVVAGKRIGKDEDFPSDIGIIIETPTFISYQSAFANLKNLAVIRGKIKDQRIKEVIRMVGLDPEDKKRVGKFSLGMRQRLGIAQAIMEDPGLLVMDEPMNGLDKEGVEDMRKLFKDLKEEGKTILICSHNAEDIDILCDQVFEMEKGVLTKIR
ncbi:MAG: ATP-binding cassette domain-containing protein [Eubacterium sp.]|nr:ATP-binding cassette domain-containing protein [Eubacterium sp.]